MSSLPRGAELDELRAFEAVARLGTVGAAARELARTQPSISARLASLEGAWGTRLFVRRARGMELTPEGRSLLASARAVLDAAALLDRAAGLPLAEDATVRLGSGDALGRGLVPRALKRLVAERPGVSVRVREGSGERLARDLREGAIDLALLPRASGAAEAGLAREPLLSSEVDALLPPGRRAPRRGLGLLDLADSPLVMLLPGSSFRAHVTSALEAAGLPLRLAVEVGSYSLVRRFVAAGLGPAPVPAAAFDGEAERPDGVTRVRLDGVARVAWDLATRAGTLVPPATSRLVELLRAEAGHAAG